MAAMATLLALLYPIKLRPPDWRQKAMISASYAAGPVAVLGPPFHDVAPVLGRMIPLPSGTWHMITQLNAQRNGTLIFARIMLARLRGDRLTGLVVVQGTMAPVNLPAATGYQCQSGGEWFARIISPHDTTQQECWNSSTRLPAAWARPDASPIYLHGLQRMREGGIGIPKIVIGVNWFQKTLGSVTLVDYFFAPNFSAPDDAWQGRAASPPVRAYISELKAWSKAWTPLVERGVNDQLQEADVKAVSAKHPE